MRFLEILILVCSLSLSIRSYAQTQISGVVLDSISNSPLAFVNIGIESKNVGTVSDANGGFSLEIPDEHLPDSLTFSMIGYKPLQLLIASLNESRLLIKLSENIVKLGDVEINAERLVERRYGIKRRNPIIHFADGMFQENDVFEIGQLIKLKSKRAQITSVNIYLFDSPADSVTIRINFYKLEDGKPTARLNKKSIVQRHTVRDGWLSMDISSKEIIMTGDFVVSLEFIPTEVDSQNISYEVKLGGSSKSFYRTNSLGSWNTPPHHYCIYVTALVDKSVPTEPEEAETLPANTLWSKNVMDSFKIFLRTPASAAGDSTRIPVLICLDANAYFDYITHIVDELLRKRKVKVEPAIVGIGYQNAYLMDSLRVRNYTFPKATISDSLSLSGGGKDFYNFISCELIPYLDRSNQIDKDRMTLLGHSFGGYFVTYSMLRDHQQEPVFQNYVAASPSLWYNEGYIIKAFDTLPRSSNASRTLYLTFGEPELEHIEHYFESFKKSVGRTHAVKVESKTYPKLGHMGAAIPAFEDAIESILGKESTLRKQ